MPHWRGVSIFFFVGVCFGAENKERFFFVFSWSSLVFRFHLCCSCCVVFFFSSLVFSGLLGEEDKSSVFFLVLGEDFVTTGL